MKPHDIHWMLMRRLVAGEPASVHNGLVHIYNVYNQGVVKGHMAKDVEDLVSAGWVRVTDSKWGFQDIDVTPRGAWMFRRRIFGWDGFIAWMRQQRRKDARRRKSAALPRLPGQRP